MVTNINWDDNFAIKWDDINYIYGLVTNINEHQLTSTNINYQLTSTIN